MRALPMMSGQLASLAFVGICCMLGVGAVLAHYSFAFKVLNVIAGLYLLYLGAMLFFSKGQLSITKVSQLPSKKQMFLNGAVVCISNPKRGFFYRLCCRLFWTRTIRLARHAYSLSRLRSFLSSFARLASMLLAVRY